MPRLVNLLNNDSLLPLIIPVLFNIIVDYGTCGLMLTCISYTYW